MSFSSTCPPSNFGITKYDRGARFDLKLPHVEIGYTHPDADVMAKVGNAFKNVFGFGKKDADDEGTPKYRARCRSGCKLAWRVSICRLPLLAPI